jgi:hypothetical protein
VDRTIVIRSFIIAVCLSAIAYLSFGKGAAIAVAVGALIAGANFRLSSGMLRKIIVPGVNPTRGSVIGVISFILRYIVVGVALFAAIRAGIHPIFLIVGVSALVVSVLVSTVKVVREQA